MSMVQIRGLYKSYIVGAGKSARHLSVLEGLDLEVEKAEFVSLVGPSGCGKTSILRILAGMTQPDAGSVYINNQDCDGAEVDIGMAPQSPALLPWFPVSRNVLLPALMSGKGSTRYLTRLDHLLRLVGLDGFANVYPHQLSRGMAQRVSLCRALLLRPRVLLMDEPFSSLDSMSREQLDQTLETVWRDQAITTVFVTHNLEEAVFLSDRVVVLSPRPARIKAVVSIRLGRPRTAETLQLPELFDHVREIRLLLDESDLENKNNRNEKGEVACQARPPRGETLRRI